MATLDTHAPDDLLVPGLTIVFCGAAAATKAAAQGAYYAEPTNRFWKTLHEVGLTPAQIEPDQYTQLTEYGIGLTWDTPGLDERIAAHTPRILAFNGLGPARAVLGKSKLGAGRYPEPFAGAEVWVLPSTSPAASRTWDLEVWERFADHVRSLAPAPPAAATPTPSPAAAAPTPPPAASQTAPPPPAAGTPAPARKRGLLVPAAAVGAAVAVITAVRRRISR